MRWREEELAEVRADLLRVFGVMRARSSRFYREFMSVRDLPKDDSSQTAMPVRRQTLGPGGLVAFGALGTLADVSLSSVLMGALQEQRRVATVGLAVQVVRKPLARQVRAIGELVSVSNHFGVSRCQMVDQDNGLLAVATGTYAVRTITAQDPWLTFRPSGLAEDANSSPVDPVTLGQEESWLLSHVESQLSRYSQDGPYCDFLGIDWLKRGSGSVEATWLLGPHLWNRSGSVHGGAIFGALGAAALASLPADSPGHLIEQHVQFVRPGRGHLMKLESQLLRRGRQISLIQGTVIDEDGHAVASALT